MIDEDEYEERVSFVGCTCGHDPYQHSWGQCDVHDCGDDVCVCADPEPTCECEGGWEQ